MFSKLRVTRKRTRVYVYRYIRISGSVSRILGVSLLHATYYALVTLVPMRFAIPTHTCVPVSLRDTSDLWSGIDAADGRRGC